MYKNAMKDLTKSMTWELGPEIKIFICYTGNRLKTNFINYVKIII